MMQLELSWPVAKVHRYVFVDCEDERGNRWCHKTSDPAGTIEQVTEMPGVKARVRGLG